MILRTTHPVFLAEVVGVTPDPDPKKNNDPKYDLVSITEGVEWRMSNVRPRYRTTGVNVTGAVPGDLVLVYDRPGDLRVYVFEGIPFDPC